MGRKLTKEEMQTGLELFFPNFLEGYRARVNEYYVEEHSKYPDFFAPMNKCSLKAIIFTFNTYLIFSESQNEKLNIIFATEEENAKLKKLLNAPDHIFRKELYEIYKIEENRLIKLKKFWDLNRHLTLSFHDFDENHQRIVGFSRSEGIKSADWDHMDLEIHKSLKETMKPSAEYNNFDVETLIRTVDSESFRYEFEESVKAYNSELYLAAGATAGIAIENLLKTLIVRHLGSRALPKRTFIKDFIEVLKTHKIIDERMANRISGFSFVRNSSSHTNTGKVTKEDVDQGYYLIKELVNFLP